MQRSEFGACLEVCGQQEVLPEVGERPSKPVLSQRHCRWLRRSVMTEGGSGSTLKQVAGGNREPRLLETAALELPRTRRDEGGLRTAVKEMHTCEGEVKPRYH